MDDVPIEDIPGLDAAAKALLQAASSPARAAAGTVLFRPGETCERLVLLAEGRVQVKTLSESGRELLLYQVRPGETCVLSFACLVGRRLYQAEGVCETDVAGRAIGRSTVLELMAVSPAFRERIIDVQSSRIYELIGLIDEVAFHRTESRLAGRLIELAGEDGVVHSTHQQLAQDLGTAREVISRRLKRLELLGLVEVERGRIVIREPARLRHLAM
ncbi:MAG: Crp/Fnr family transcriptional regulator [Hyphomicrobiaceae bacterium]